MTTAPGTAVATQPHYAGVGMTAFGGGGSLPALQSLADVVSIAQLMAKAGIAVRKHLRENPGACLGVTMQALRWEMDPFAVANKTYAVNDQLAYEAQLVAAVVISRAPIAKRPKYTYEGEGAERKCTVTVEMLDGDVLDYTTPKVGKIPVKNSPLWKADEDQQLGYYAIRSWARRHTPDVILGVYTPEEIEHSDGLRDVTPQGSGLAGRLGQSDTAKEGFSEAGVNEETEGDAKPRKPRKATPVPPIEEVVAEIAEIMQPEDPTTAPQVSQDAPEEVEATLGAEAAEDGPTEAEIAAARAEAEADSDFPEGLRPQPDAPADAEPMVQSGSAGTETSPETSSEAQPEPDGTAQTASHSDEPESEEAVDDLPPGLSEFADAVEAATEWKHVHGAMHDFFRGDEFKSFTIDRQNGIRNQTWEIARSIHDAPDFTKNLTAYRLWIEWMDEPASIEEVWSVLQEAGAFKDAAPDSQKNLRNATEARLTKLTR